MHSTRTKIKFNYMVLIFSYILFMKALFLVLLTSDNPRAVAKLLQNLDQDEEKSNDFLST